MTPIEQYDPVDRRAPLILGGHDFHSITEVVVRPIEAKRPPLGWWLTLGLGVSLLGLLGVSVAYLVWEGTGIWGLNNPAGWGWAIVNFVFWVGIGHAGTLISAILFLFRQKWRTSINRAAEAMTIFAVACALLFPTIHVGRIWLLYWVFPIPNQMEMWPNFRSPLLWDVFAVSIYGTVSLLFWYVGLIPDLATMRDRAKTKIRRYIYGALSLGWRGSMRHWLHYERAYLLLAALATPLVLSVHSVVSFDFAISQLPGWHTTIFPPYFVAGAIFSGFAMVLTLMIVARKVYGLQAIITIRHFDNMAKIILLTGSLVGYAYAMEFFIAWYGANEYESFAFVNRAFGPYAWAYWTMILCNVISPQLFWFRRFRTSIPLLFIVSIFVNIGMWFERFVITVTSLSSDFLLSSWDYYSPTIWDIATFLGSFGLFITLFTLFVRYVPMVAMAEVKTVLPEADPHWHDPDAVHEDHGDNHDHEDVADDVEDEVVALDETEDTTDSSSAEPDEPDEDEEETAAEEDESVDASSKGEGEEEPADEEDEDTGFGSGFELPGASDKEDDGAVAAADDGGDSSDGEDDEPEGEASDGELADASDEEDTDEEVSDEEDTDAEEEDGESSDDKEKA